MGLLTMYGILMFIEIYDDIKQSDLTPSKLARKIKGNILDFFLNF